MALNRTIFPTQVVFTTQATTFTWDKESGGPIRVELGIGATPIMDATGGDLSFSFLAFYNFINSVTIYFHDNNIESQIWIGQKGTLDITFETPDVSNATGALQTVTYSAGTAFIMAHEPAQVYGQVQNIAVHWMCQVADEDIGVPIVPVV